jgi:hypothetical protein
MPSRTERLSTFNLWNRKSHYYLGLYFLFFLWLFAFTGLLLNHSWQFSEFWPSRKVVKFERAVEVPRADSDLERARSLMLSLGIKGEIDWTATRPDSTVFEFRVNRPGLSSSVTAYPEKGLAVVEQIEINTWGILRVLHTFTGLRAGDERNDRDWFLTTLWVLSMDAVSIGLTIMVLSGMYMLYGLPTKRKLGSVALLLGTAACAMFVFGLRWIY